LVLEEGGDRVEESAMRLLRLDLGPGSDAVDLHPFVTVVRGLDQSQRELVVGAVRSLARGSTRGVHGLVQHQGLLVELDGLGDDLVPAVTEADVVVDCGPAGGADRPAPAGWIEQQRLRVEIDAVAVEEIRADFDPSARARIADLERQLDPRRDGAERARAERLAVSRALAAIAGLDPVVLVAPPGALELRRRWAAHTARVADAKGHFEHLLGAVREADDRLDQARHLLAEAERAAMPVLLSRDEEARLEQLSFPAMDESRRGRWRKALRPEERVEMQALLEKAGVESWTAYTVYRADPIVAPELLEAAARARHELELAKAGLAAAKAGVVDDPLTAELNQDAEVIRHDARPHLGTMLWPDVGRALDELVVEQENQPWAEAAGQLRQLLDELGIARRAGLAPDAGPLQVIGCGQEWLAAQDRAGDPDPDALAAELARARRGLTRHERALARIGRAESVAAESATMLVELEAHLAAGPGAERDGPCVARGLQTAAAVLDLVGPVAAQVELDAGGSLPIAIVGDLYELAACEVTSLMGRLSELAAGVQVLVLSDHEALAQWARDAGLDRALASQPGPGRG
jgi:hypothetical protein